MIDQWYNTQYIAQRKSTTSSTGTDILVAVFTSTCLLEPITEKTQLFDEANIGKEFKMYCKSTDDIRIADLLSIESTNYSIQAITLYSDLEGGQETHKEVRVYKR